MRIAPLDYRRHARDVPLHHVADHPEARLDEDVAPLVEVDREDVDNQCVAGLRAANGDRAGGRIGAREAVAIVARRALDILRFAQPAAARVMGLDRHLGGSVETKSRRFGGVDRVDNAVP